jgi:hypothetical protein
MRPLNASWYRAKGHLGRTVQSVERLTQALRSSDRHESIGVLDTDLDGFKQVNDSLVRHPIDAGSVPGTCAPHPARG